MCPPPPVTLSQGLLLFLRKPQLMRKSPLDTIRSCSVSVVRPFLFLVIIPVDLEGVCLPCLSLQRNCFYLRVLSLAEAASLLYSKVYGTWTPSH